jgi:hypothetical protein
MTNREGHPCKHGPGASKRSAVQHNRGRLAISLLHGLMVPWWVYASTVIVLQSRRRVRDVTDCCLLVPDCQESGGAAGRFEGGWDAGSSAQFSCSLLSTIALPCDTRAVPLLCALLPGWLSSYAEPSTIAALAHGSAATSGAASYCWNRAADCSTRGLPTRRSELRPAYGSAFTAQSCRL